MISTSKISAGQNMQYVARQNGDFDTSDELQHGTIIELFPDTGYGRIRTRDGRQVHFHRTSIAPGNNKALEPGQEVRFTEIPGAEGSWADNIHFGR